MDKRAQIKALEAKLTQAEEKYRIRLGKFKGVPHESAAGELEYSDLKVWEDHIEAIKAEILSLKKKE